MPGFRQENRRFANRVAFTQTMFVTCQLALQTKARVVIVAPALVERYA